MAAQQVKGRQGSGARSWKVAFGKDLLGLIGGGSSFAMELIETFSLHHIAQVDHRKGEAV